MISRSGEFLFDIGLAIAFTIFLPVTAIGWMITDGPSDGLRSAGRVFIKAWRTPFENWSENA